MQILSVTQNDYGYSVAYGNKTLIATPQEVAQILEDQAIIECYAENDIDGLIVFMDGDGEQFHKFMENVTDAAWAGIITSMEMSKIRFHA